MTSKLNAISINYGSGAYKDSKSDSYPWNGIETGNRPAVDGGAYQEYYSGDSTDSRKPELAPKYLTAKTVNDYLVGDNCDSLDHEAVNRVSGQDNF